MVSRITTMVNDYIEEVIEPIAMGEKVHWDANLMIAPNPQGEAAPIVILTITLPSLMLGQHMVGTLVLPHVLPSMEQVRDAVTNLIEGLRKARTEQLSSFAQSENGDSPGGSLRGPGWADQPPANMREGLLP